MEVIVVDSKDAGIQEYLKHLNIQTNKESHICVIAKSKGEYMIPFLF